MSEVENAFGTHVEEQVKDREVGQKAMLLLIYLIIGFGLEVRICLRVLGTDGRAIVYYIVYS